MMHLLWPAALVLGACLGSTHAALAQITDEEARSELTAVVKPLMGIKPEGFLNIRRREDLEEDLYRFQLRKDTRAAYFYQVSPEGQFWNGKEIHEVIVTHGPHDRYAAVSSATGDVFPLFGFHEATDQFNRLVAETPLRISERWAEIYVFLYLSATNGPYKDYLFFHPVGLRHMIEGNFYMEHKKGEAERRFKKWWKSFERSKLKLHYDMVTETDGENYIVTFEKVRPIASWLMLHGEDDKDVHREPAIEEWKLKISPNGQVTVLEVKTLFSNE